MENELSPVVDALPALVWTALPHGHIDFVNQRWFTYTGRQVDEIRGRGWQHVIHPDDLPELLERWHAMLTSAESHEMEARMRRFDGEYRRVVFRASPVTDASGRLIKWCGTVSDVEDQRRAEDAVRVRELSFRLIVDSIPVPVAVTTPTGDVEGLNQQTLEYFGKTLEELKNWAISDVVHPQDLERTIADQLSAHAAGGAYNIQSRHRRADGVYRWFNVRGFPLRDADGHILRWFHLLIDIDDRKRAEEALRRSEAFLAEAQHLSLTGSFSWQVATGKMAWSAELYRICELEQGTPMTLELIGSRVHPDDRMIFPLLSERARSEGDDFEYELRLQMPDQSVKYVHAMGHATRDQDGQLEYVGAVQDVTERRHSEETLEKVRSELAHVARVTSLGALTASIAHEVNQPLSGIITNASTCLRMLASNPPNLDGARETARRTIRDGHRASDVITRLRALFAKREATTEPVDLNEATREVIALSYAELRRSKVILQPELADDLPPVQGDRIQLQQVILNLLLNASDAMSDVDDRPRQLAIKTERDEGDHVRLTVQDSGVGLELQSMDKLFEAFYTTKRGGMGIGLSVSRSIVERHHGRMWAAPNDGPGATFSFSIPLGAAAETREGAVATRTP